MIPKIAFLFLTVGTIYHEPTWIDFFDQHQDHYSLYVHPKESLDKKSFFSEAVIPKRKYTTWANTMKAQQALLKEALKDPANQKFIYISETTIPLVPFEKVYTRLMAHPYSQFSYRKNPYPSRTFDKLKKSMIYNNSQWIVLSRKHAQLIADDQSLIKIMTRYPHDQEHYPATLLAYHNLLNEVVNKDTTLVIWTGTDAHPHLFKKLTKDPYTKFLIKALQKKKFLFARKFYAKCDLTFLQPYLPNSYLHATLNQEPSATLSTSSRRSSIN